MRRKINMVNIHTTRLNESVFFLASSLLVPGPSTAEVSVTSIEAEVASATASACGSDSEPESQPWVRNELHEEDDEHEDEAIQHGN